MSRPKLSMSLHRPRIVLSVVVTVLAVFVIAMAPALQRVVRNPAAGDAAIGVNRIRVVNDAFDPPAAQVPVGTTVTWTFDDGGRNHNVVGEGWSSQVVAAGEYGHLFTEAGTYRYRCTLHWGMEGRVDVVQR